MKHEFEKTLTSEFICSKYEYNNGRLLVKIASSKKKVGEEAGWIGHSGYRMVAINRQNIFVHRLIYIMFHGYVDGNIDHIDGNKTNNRIENLRIANKSQNACNSKTRSDNTSGIKNVYFDKARNKWCAEIMINRKKVHLGRFESLSEATNTVAVARKLLHRDFANSGTPPAFMG